MKDRNVIVIIASIVFLIAIIFIVFHLPLNATAATLMVGVGTFVSGIVAIFSVRETRNLAELSIYPNLRISAVGLLPGPTTPVEINCSDTIYLENIGPGIAKDIKLVLTELRLNGDAKSEEALDLNDTMEESTQPPRIARKDFMAPVRAIETSVSTVREPFRAWMIFSPYGNQYPAFVLRSEGSMKLFRLTVHCKNMRNVPIEPVIYILKGAPYRGPNPDYAKNWLQWQIYPNPE